MNVGMLWLDDDPNRSLAEKLQRAANYYTNKYGRTPDTCLVNNKALGKEMKVGEIRVIPAQNILKHHFWLGCQSPNGQEDKNT